MKNEKTLMFLLASSLVIGCANIAPAQVLDAQSVVTNISTAVPVDARPKVLLACIGGWKSCTGERADDQYIGKGFLDLVEQVRTCRPDLDVSYVMFCSKGIKAARFERPVHYYGRFGAGTTAERDIGAVIATHKKTPDSKVFIIGHSHGGWMAMRATLCLGQIDGLFTLEPVSAPQCDLFKYFRNRTRKIFKRRQRIVQGCRRAPQDLDHQKIWSACSGNWTNFVLSADSPRGDVYSSEIPIANNISLYAPADEDFSAHQNLGNSEKTWSVIESMLLSNLAPAMLPSTSMIPVTSVPFSASTEIPNAISNASEMIVEPTATIPSGGVVIESQSVLQSLPLELPIDTTNN